MTKLDCGSPRVSLTVKFCVLHFHPRREAFVRKEQRHLDGLRETPLAPAIAADFVLEKGVECPVDTLDDFLRKQQPKLVGIGPVRLHRGFLFPHHHFLFIRIDVFFIHHLLFRAFLMENPAGAKLVFGEKRGVQRNLVPVCQAQRPSILKLAFTVS